MHQFDHIGRYIYAVLNGFKTQFRDGGVLGDAGRFYGHFYPGNRITTATSGTYFPRDHYLRYGVGVGIDNRNNVGPEMGSERWTPEPIVYLLRHPANPLNLTPEAIAALLTPPIDGTVLWQEVKLDCSCVLVNGKPAFYEVERMAKALGYGAPPQPAKPPAVEASSSLPELAPVEQRAKELGEIARGVWHQHPLFFGEEIMARIVTEVAMVGLPIWRRSQERIAQRVAEILREERR